MGGKHVVELLLPELCERAINTLKGDLGTMREHFAGQGQTMLNESSSRSPKVPNMHNYIFLKCLKEAASL
jgi:hypothetical protein